LFNPNSCFIHEEEEEEEEEEYLSYASLSTTP
jgi:hypothetical protein